MLPAVSACPFPCASPCMEWPLPHLIPHVPFLTLPLLYASLHPYSPLQPLPLCPFPVFLQTLALCSPHTIHPFTHAAPPPVLMSSPTLCFSPPPCSPLHCAPCIPFLHALCAPFSMPPCSVHPPLPCPLTPYAPSLNTSYLPHKLPWLHLEQEQLFAWPKLCSKQKVSTPPSTSEREKSLILYLRKYGK